MGLLGLQFVDRLILAFMPQKYFPEQPFCRQVSHKDSLVQSRGRNRFFQVSVGRMHLFTFIQIVCFGVLLAVNLIQMTALAFPFVLTVIALFRMFVMPRIFESYELDAVSQIKGFQGLRYYACIFRSMDAAKASRSRQFWKRRKAKSKKGWIRRLFYKRPVEFSRFA